MLDAESVNLQWPHHDPLKWPHPGHGMLMPPGDWRPDSKRYASFLAVCGSCWPEIWELARARNPRVREGLVLSEPEVTPIVKTSSFAFDPVLFPVVVVWVVESVVNSQSCPRGCVECGQVECSETERVAVVHALHRPVTVHIPQQRCDGRPLLVCSWIEALTIADLWCASALPRVESSSCRCR